MMLAGILQWFDSLIQFVRSLSVAGWGLLVGVVTLVVVCLQIVLMMRQTKIMNRQLEIMEKQAELLARRADFTVTCKPTTLPPQPAQPRRLRVEFSAHNTGNKTARDFYWHIFIPQALASTVAGFRGHDTNSVRDFRGVRYDYYERLKKDPLYPTREMPLGWGDVIHPGAGQSFTVLWQVISEDGKAPIGQEELGTLKIVAP
jgi:hypothetical protein